MQAIKELRPPVFFKQQDIVAAQARRWTVAALSAQIGQLNTALKETRLKPGLAEDITADLLIAIAKQARRA
jgi:DNA polymerase-3 subunit delta